MHISYSAQRSDNLLEYKFDNNKIFVTYRKVELPKENDQHSNNYKDNGVIMKEFSDIIDFDQLIKDGTVKDVTTQLPINPILKADINDGVLYIKLLKYHGKDADYEDRFPRDMEV